MRRRGGLLALLTLGAFACGLAGTPASAHPLNNFSINQHHSLTVHQDRVDDRAVIDIAEIPTLQGKKAVDRDDDGEFSPAELDRAAGTECSALLRGLRAEVAGTALKWRSTGSHLAYLPGENGLSVSRYECGFTAPADLSGPARLRFATEYQATHVGWREIVASGVGVRFTAASVAERSVSDELRSYPNDLLSTPLDQRTADISATPGSGASPGLTPRVDGVGPMTRLVAPVQNAFNDLLARDLTVPVGLAAVVLSMLLGAAHAVLPGHGKTVVAAYLVGRHGGVRDAILVGSTVTFTHTAGVLGMGLLLSASAAVSGDGLLAWLGVVSGALIGGIGLLLLRSAWRHRGEPAAAHGHGEGHTHTHGLSFGRRGGHGHGHGHGHAHDDHAHEAPVPADVDVWFFPTPQPAEAAAAVAVAVAERPRAQVAGEYVPDERTPFSRRGLVGLGIAGGLVPSPSALVVLLGAIALGRTWFGVGLVFGYGIGMAATLMAAGLLLVKFRDGAAARMAERGTRMGRRLGTWTPIFTALLVVLVGAGLVLNELPRI